MALIVQKFGGTSVGTLERIENVAKRVTAKRDKGHNIVVVVSALSGETDRLIELAHKMNPAPRARELDLLVSTGEQISSALLTMAIHKLGYKAIAYTGFQVGIMTNNIHTKARIEKIETTRLKKALKEGHIVVVAGFQGVDEDYNITTLGRGGSDTTAIALAAVLSADMCEIYTDVDGVYTADPRIVPEAQKIDVIDYDEMLELASLGAKVMQARSVEFAAKYNIPFRVLSSFEENTEKSGTLVTREDKSMEQPVIRGVSVDKNQAKVTIRHLADKPGIAARLFRALAEANINVDMIVQNVSEKGYTDISFTVSRDETKKIPPLIAEIQKDVHPKDIMIDDEIAKVSIVGIGMKSHSGVAAQMFESLAEKEINIEMISTSEIKISCVIERSSADKAVKVLHAAFGLGGKQ